ncbi:PAP/OAS1 substrate-binding domain-containing protein [Pleomassaria siparia CBS 279.74]|uniref:polynucleotide adenylyltransferase n=1 Tax=Pleomassaria siparia CBS 279.74 TaxID=1314801 RepID=A0A6G1KH00_9PLEO|nr:PAP/OAS1 substrate-binding domain-containing protein [Pleomassaria siparia CBS 279.74]
MASDQTTASLEAQLRDMILNNVAMPSGQTNQKSPRGGNQQHDQGGRGGFGRGRGRGGAWRNSPNQLSQGQNPNVPHVAATATSPGFRGGYQRGNRNRQSPTTHAHPQSPRQDGIETENQDGSTPPTRQPNLSARPPRQANHQDTITRQLPVANTRPPKILARPYNNNNNNTSSRNLGPGSPSPQYSPRNYGHQMQQHMNLPLENPVVQESYLDNLAAHEIPKVEIEKEELEGKEAFRQHLETLCKKALADNYSGEIATIALVAFGSLASGFATPGSDMDLAIVPAWKDPARVHETEIDREIPRLLERAILDDKLGARLLTRTRVPILKVCQLPTEELYTALFDERKKWDELSEEERYPPPLPPLELAAQLRPLIKPLENVPIGNGPTPKEAAAVPKAPRNRGPRISGPKKEDSSTPSSTSQDTTESKTSNSQEQKPRHDRPWQREKVLGPLDFPKTGVGIQCDINFENPLGIHNTHLLRCYSLCDPRVRPMVLFVKSWAKRRKINSSYSGSLSSYGWVLMVLHYLVNVAQPPVCPNLQSNYRPTLDLKAREKEEKEMTIQGYLVRFWRNEVDIIQAARMGQLSHNKQSIGALLRGFFQYFASLGGRFHNGQRVASFYWTSEVLSLRTQGGLCTKLAKGWTGAKTTVLNGKEVRHRYLFSIEDPFELDHNVARTVTHNGIVAIRDEFRRAWRILSAVGRHVQPEGGIFDEVVEKPLPSPVPMSEAEGEQKEVIDAQNPVGF